MKIRTGARGCDGMSGPRMIERSGGGLKLELYRETCRRRMLLMMGGVVINLRVGLG